MESRHLIALTILISSSHDLVYGYHQRGCSLDVLNNTNGALMPLIINSNTSPAELVVPERGTVSLKKEESVIFACSGKRNKLEDVRGEEVTATCEGNDELKVNQYYLHFEDVKCKKSVQASVKSFPGKCEGGGNSHEIGFNLEDISEWLPLIFVCYNEEKGAALYSSHLLHGEEIKYAAKSSGRPSFSNKGVPPRLRPSTAYHRSYQRKEFQSLLGGRAKEYMNDNSYLATGHLSPYADFVYLSSQRSSNFYINACPQWQSINNGNWKSVEFLVRRTAEMYKKTFQIITGTYDVLRLPNENDVLVEINLMQGKIPVPKYVWKIMYDPKSSTGIAFVIFNNPFANIYDKPEFCRNVCNIYGWSKSQWNNFSKGYVFCCELRDFQKVVKNVPNLHVRGVLNGNN